jgi:hypothetical protein
VLPPAIEDAQLPRARTRPLLIGASLAIAAICSSLWLVRNTDLGIYWYAVNGFFSGIRSAYGPDSGVGHPLEYRYAPVTYLILYPLRFVSLRVAGFWWMLAAWAAAIATVWTAVRVRGLRFSNAAVVLCCVYMLAYVVLAIRYGNVQPFAICAIFASLMLSEKHPGGSGILLALAITFKVWPILFLPWLFRRARLRAATYSLVWLAVIWMLPLPIFGASGYWALIQQWYGAISGLEATYPDVHYVLGQSLRELMVRHFTAAAPALKDVPAFHIFELSQSTVTILWAVISVAVYSWFVVCMLRSDDRKMWAWDGLAFVLYSIVEPYAVKSGLISLGPAVLTAGCLYTLGMEEPAMRPMGLRAGRLFLGACLLAILGTVTQYRAWQHFLLGVGLDFWAELLLLSAMFLWIARTNLPERLTGSLHS